MLEHKLPNLWIKVPNWHKKSQIYTREKLWNIWETTETETEIIQQSVVASGIYFAVVCGQH